MSGIKIGDITFDSRRAVYVHSLNAIVCAGLHDALELRISQGLRKVVSDIDAILEEYQPESLIVIGAPSAAAGSIEMLNSKRSALARVARRWGASSKLILISENINSHVRAGAEALGFEVHNDLVWGYYRFVEHDDAEALELQLLTVVGELDYHLPSHGCVFLKGFGKLILPSVAPKIGRVSILQRKFDRYDVFALGERLVLPLGKVAVLRKHVRDEAVLAAILPKPPSIRPEIIL